MTDAVALTVRLLRATFVTTQLTPVFPVELSAHSRFRHHDLPLDEGRVKSQPIVNRLRFDAACQSQVPETVTLLAQFLGASFEQTQLSPLFAVELFPNSDRRHNNRSLREVSIFRKSAVAACRSQRRVVRTAVHSERRPRTHRCWRSGISYVALVMAFTEAVNLHVFVVVCNFLPRHLDTAATATIDSKHLSDYF